MLYDVKGRFILHKIKEAESKFKLVKVTQRAIGSNKVPYIVTNDARTIRYPNPDINIGDTIRLDLEKNTVVEHFTNEPGRLAYVTGGNNVGRVGQVVHVERHIGGFDIVHLRDSNGKTFATRLSNVFIIGNKKPSISLPAEEGNYLDIL